MSKRQRLMDEDWGISYSSSSDCDSSDNDEEEIKDDKAKGPCKLCLLPFEIISHIFILSQNTDLPITCQSLYQQLYYCHETIKIKFLLYRSKNDIQKAFEEAIRFPFFNNDMMERFDKLFGDKISFTDKKIPARLFLQEPTSSLADRDALILNLLERGASPNRPKGYPLIKSAQLGRMDQVKLLIKFGADPSIKNNMALRVCAARNNREMVDYFLDEVNVKPDSETLKACVQRNLWDMCDVLVKHGAIPDMSTIDFT